MKELLFFSSNNGKIIEVDRLFRKQNIKLSSLKNFPNLISPNETGKTFIENAKIKSEYGFKKTGIPCFADDSGICIEALNYKPSINSKRFLSKFENNKICFDYILNKVNKTKKYRAHFVCSISFTINKKYSVAFEGKVYGNIDYPKGKNGFGYDPIFIPDGYDKSFAQLNLNIKNLISHRSIAVRKLLHFCN